MAETVEMRMERAIPEYETMRTLKIMDADEIKEIIKQREHYDYLMARKEKTLKHFLEYIGYERNLLKLINERKHQNMNIKLEHSIVQRIRSLYIQASVRFAADIRIWNSYIKFMMKANYSTAEVAAVFEQALKFHDSKIDIWLKYIKWELDINKDEIKGRQLLLRSLRSHSNSLELYLEFFDLELKNLKPNPQSDPLRPAMVLYNNVKRKFSSIEVLITILDKITSYQYTELLQLEIWKDLKSIHCTEELFWNTIAQRELKGELTFKPAADSNVEQPSDPKKRPLKTRIEICVQVYKAALSAINTDKMWSMYLDAMLALNMDLTTEASLKRKVLGRAFKDADEANVMSESHYLQYIRILVVMNADEQDILKTIKRAVDKYPKSLALWQAQMRFYIQRNETVDVLETFNSAKKHLGDESFSIWELYLGYLTILPGSDSCIQKVYDSALMEVNPIFNNLKAKYIEWASRHYGIKRARNIYKMAIKKSLPCIEIYQKMAEMESYEIEPDIKSWRNCLEAASTQFGQHRTDIWLQYINFEVKLGDPKNFSKLCERAINTLKPEFVDNFLAERDLLQIGVVKL